MREALALLPRSLISLAGSVLATVSAIVFLTLFVIEQLAVTGGAGPYLGILSYLIVPTIFVAGLLMIPLGIWRRRVKDRRLLAAGREIPRAPIIDFNRPRTRRLALLVSVLTSINAVIIATATYKGVEVMDSTGFCGGACHAVMGPEHTAYQRSPHSRVKCTECHIGSGAGWFLKSKLSGSWQVISVALDLFPRPLPTPVHSLRPAKDTCEQCHAPEKLIGERLQIFTKFSDDEQQTERKSVLLMKVGGVRQGKGEGIHWHADPKHKVRFRSEKKRQKIYEVELTQADGTVKLFKPQTPAPPAELAEGWRTMDCIDCHNRPAHVYRRPEQELDAALASGQLDRELPFIKREGLKALAQSFASHQEARSGIRQALFGFYEKEYPQLARDEPKRLETAAEVLWELYRRNVFPEMKISWGTYPNFLEQEAGCFRCHDNEHLTESGEKISKKCSKCHETLATDEEEPEILEMLHP